MQRLTDPSTGGGRSSSPPTRCSARLAFALAFLLRFLDDGGRIPDRYETMLLGSVAFVAIGKSLVLELLGQHHQWWRYFRLPDLWPLVRSLAVASALLVLVFVLVKPYPDSLPRSVVIFDFILSCALLGGARLARRSLAERPQRAAPRPRRAACSSSAPARAGRWSSASCS